jgi:CO/xanthine dehydrogenase Mo-binding subunit
VSEALIKLITPALANAFADATSIRSSDLSLAPNCIYRRMYESQPNKENRINQMR